MLLAELCPTLALGTARRPQEAMEDSAADHVIFELDVTFGAIISNDLERR